MPPKKAASSDAADSGNGTPVNGMRDNELRFIKAVFDNMTQKPDADWSKVADDLGLKDAKCAKERFRQMSVRHGWRIAQPSSSSSSSSSSIPPNTPVKAAGGNKKGVTGPSGDGRVTKRTAPRTPRTPRKLAAKKEEPPSDDEAVAKKDGDQGVKTEGDETEVEV
ncbi:hypothetical protein PT974_02460 [Cladobotryum mycophilum]|uniref:Myb-like domain-containing protein n=1 Tax=Cladobotryum mycophilum TaxID=491253 RepID=A0ABR0SY59_9HYPO